MLPNFVVVLLEMTRYGKHSLRAEAFKLLARHMSQKMAMIDKAMQVRVLAYPTVRHIAIAYMRQRLLCSNNNYVVLPNCRSPSSIELFCGHV